VVNPLASELQAYVMANLSLTQVEAVSWLNENTPHWRKAQKNVSFERIVISDTGDDSDE
jgi:hypothetical protein